MVHVITRFNRNMYLETLKDMFSLRYHVAVHELNWSIPDVGNQSDIDEYDTDHTVYFVDLDKRGRVVATARLNPTTLPHLMSEVFSGFCENEGIPVAEDIFELSRFLVKKTGINRRDNIRTQARICLAIVEYCLATGIRQLSWLSYKRSYPLALRMWQTRPLGLPRVFEDDGKEYIAAISDINLTALRRTRDLAHTQDMIGHITLPLAQFSRMKSLVNSDLKAFG